MTLNILRNAPQDRFLCLSSLQEIHNKIIVKIRSRSAWYINPNKVGFNHFPGCEKRFNSSEEVSISIWMESSPKTVRKVRFKTDHYIVNDN